MTERREINLDEMTDEQKEKLLKRLRSQNHRITTSMATEGYAPTNVGTERHESFISYMVQLGIITEEQMLNFDIMWEIHLQQKLQSLAQQVVEEKQRAKVAQTLVLPNGHKPGGGPTLITP